MLLWTKQGKPWPQTCGQMCNSVSPAHAGAFPAEWICPRMGWICFPHLPGFPHLQQLPVLTSNPLLDSAVRWVPLTSGLCGVPEVLAGGGWSDRCFHGRSQSKGSSCPRALISSTSRVLGRTAGDLHIPALDTAFVETSESSSTQSRASCVPLKVCVGAGAGLEMLRQSFLCVTLCKDNTFSSCLGFIFPAQSLSHSSVLSHFLPFPFFLASSFPFFLFQYSYCP